MHFNDGMPRRHDVTSSHVCHKRRILPIIAVVAGCSGGPPPEEPQPVATEETALQQAQRQYAELEAAYGELQADAAAANIQLLEKDARITELEWRLDALQAMLDRATGEAVTAKSKVMGAETRAEAASELAEAEIALQALGARQGGSEMEEYTQAAAYLERSADAFDEGNFGGAIFLTNQAKSLIQLGESKVSNRAEIEPTAGEVQFEAPLPLQVINNSNVRAGPGLEHEIITTLQQGTRVTGYSHKGEWIRVRLEDGRLGWIFRTLLGART